MSIGNLYFLDNSSSKQQKVNVKVIYYLCVHLIFMTIVEVIWQVDEVERKV